MRPKTAGDLMNTALHTATVDMDIEDASFSMRMANIRHIPVVDAGNQLVGILSPLDLAVAMDTPAKRREPVSTIMTRNVRYIGADGTIEEVLCALVEHKINCLPVVDGEHRLCGIITATDCLVLALDLVRSIPAGDIEHTGYRR